MGKCPPCSSYIFVRRFGWRALPIKREQLVRQLAKDAKAAGGQLQVDFARGKGGHAVIRFRGRFSVVKSGEITPLMEKVIRKQLGL